MEMSFVLKFHFKAKIGANKSRNSNPAVWISAISAAVQAIVAILTHLK